MLSASRSLFAFCLVLCLTLSAASAIADPDDAQAERTPWCYTQIMYERKLANSNSALSPEACALEGPCDQPASRDGYSPSAETPLIYMKLYFHVFANDNGSSPATTPTNVANQVNTLNADYLPYRIQFEYEMRTINDSRYRVFESQGEFDAAKDQYALDPSEQINIYVGQVNVGGEAYSFGTFPWDTDALGNRGGVVMNMYQFYPYEPATLTHELGHCIGLWHTFRGVSETTTCGSCYESVGAADADYRGDLCSDTPPTPLNYNCSPPGGTDPCSSLPWGSTAPQNYMSYAPSGCQTEFTPQQAGRMRCWILNELSSWIIVFDLQANPNFGQPPLTVNFTGLSDRTATSWSWDFDDGNYGAGPNPSNEYLAPGYYSVGATIQTPNGPYSTVIPGLVAIQADTISVADALISNGQVVVGISITNYVPLTDITIPVFWDGPLELDYVSFSTEGLRSEHLNTSRVSYVPSWDAAAFQMYGSGNDVLEPGSGEILRLTLSDQSGAATGETPVVIQGYSGYALEFNCPVGTYVPTINNGVVSKGCCTGIVGDANGDGGYFPTIGDISLLIDHLFINQTPLNCYSEADANQSGGPNPTDADITIGDITRIMDNLFITGTPLPNCF
jgi:PKD repeat protein